MKTFILDGAMFVAGGVAMGLLLMAAAWGYGMLTGKAATHDVKVLVDCMPVVLGVTGLLTGIVTKQVRWVNSEHADR